MGRPTLKPHVALCLLCSARAASSRTVSSPEDCSNSLGAPTRLLLTLALFQISHFPVTQRKPHLTHTRCRGSRRESIQHHPETTNMNHKDKQDFLPLCKTVTKIVFFPFRRKKIFFTRSRTGLGLRLHNPPICGCERGQCVSPRETVHKACCSRR